MRGGFVVVLAACFSLGCVGEASVYYEGFVIVGEGEESTYYFDEDEPDGSQPLPRAGVYLEVDGAKSCSQLDRRSAQLMMTDEEGGFKSKEVVFGGFVGSRTRILICVEVDGYAPFEYSVDYEKTNDPTHGSEFMIIRLAPEPQSPD